MSRPLFTVVIPTIGRPTLARTLESIRSQLTPADVEILVVVDTHTHLSHEAWQTIRGYTGFFNARYWEVDAGHHDWGSPQLQAGYAAAEGEWILNIGDDDVYEPFAFETIKRAVESVVEPVPLMFRTVLHPAPQRGNTVPVVLWAQPELVDKGITGQCFVIPNDQARIGRWDILVDFGFITDTVRLWDGRVEWRTEIISQCY